MAMRTLIALMMVVFSTMSVSVAMADDAATRQTDEILFCTLPAQFPGGQEALMKWIEQNKVYPQKALKKGIEGRVIVQFVVKKDGTVTNGKIVRGVDPLLDKEALRLVSIMPKWTPGKFDGKDIRSYYCLPITFKLTGGQD